MTASIAPVEIALYVTVGAAAGAAYFYLLLRTVRLHVDGAPVGRVVPLYLLRLGGAAVLFWVVAQQGPLPLLLALAGFLVVRWAFQRRAMTD